MDYIDDFGTVYAVQIGADRHPLDDGRPHIVGTVPFAPPLQKLGRMNAAGDVISCNAELDQLQLTNLYSGRLLASAAGTARGNGWTVNGAVMCQVPGVGASSLLDIHARTGWQQGVDAGGNRGTVILTPRGKRLPKSG